MRLINTITGIDLEFNISDLEKSKDLKDIIYRQLLSAESVEADSDLRVKELLDAIKEVFEDKGKNINENINQDSDTVKIDWSKVSGTPIKIPETTSYITPGRIPNTSEDAYKKYSSNLVDSQIDMSKGEIVNLSDIKLNKNKSTVMNNFSCPHCHQSTLALFKNNNGIINDYSLVLNLEANKKNSLSILNDNMKKIVLDEMSSEDKKDIVKIVLKMLKDDNKYIVADLVDIIIKFDNELLNNTILQCPCCKEEDLAYNWIEAVNYADSEHLCMFCGSDLLLSLGFEEPKCSNDDCYSNMDDDEEKNKNE